MKKLEGIKKGDVLRIEFQAVVDSLTSDPGFPIRLLPDGAKICSAPTAATISAPTFRIERIAQPVKVGDMVTWGTGAERFKVVAIEDGNGILWSSNGYATDYPLSDLRHA